MEVFRRDFTWECSFIVFRKTQYKKTTASRPFLIIVLGPLIGLDRYWSITWTVISDQHPRVCFLHCLCCVRWQIRRKDSSLAFFSFVFGSFQADLFGLWGGGGVRLHPSHPPYLRACNSYRNQSGLLFFKSCRHSWPVQYHVLWLCAAQLH